MQKKQRTALVALCCGSVLLLIALFGVYNDFFAPRLGPVGTGAYTWTTYATYTSAIIGGLCYVVVGVALYVKR